MKFKVEQAIEILQKTPGVLEALLGNLSDDWTKSSKDPNNWAPFDILGHLIHGEKTDWIDRAKIILEQGENRTFVPFDRFAQFKDSENKNLGQLLDEFAVLRAGNLEILRGFDLTADQLKLKGIHPNLGVVTLGELLATWVVHDLGHTKQITTVLAGKYKGEVGAWTEFLSILK